VLVPVERAIHRLAGVAGTGLLFLVLMLQPAAARALK